MKKYLDYILRRPFLEGQWRRAHLDLGIGCDSFAYDEFEMVLLHYRGKGRFYHGLAHIYVGLAIIDEIAGHLSKRERALLKLAFFYHDVEYSMDNKAPWTNEVLSANRAEQYLETKLPAADIARIRTLILETADHQNSTCTDPLWPFMNDADLSIMITSPKVYESYGEKVWKEYRVKYTRAQFITGRITFLKVFESKPIFRTAHMTAMEHKAKFNIDQEIIRLCGENPLTGASVF